MLIASGTGSLNGDGWFAAERELPYTAVSTLADFFAAAAGFLIAAIAGFFLTATAAFLIAAIADFFVTATGLCTHFATGLFFTAFIAVATGIATRFFGAIAGIFHSRGLVHSFFHFTWLVSAKMRCDPYMKYAQNVYIKLHSQTARKQ